MSSVLEPDDKPKSRAKKTYGTAKSGGHQVNPRAFNPGEVRLICDLAREFAEPKLTLKMAETPTTRTVDIRCDTEARTKFVEYLLGNLKRRQDLLKRMLPDVGRES